MAAAVLAVDLPAWAAISVALVSGIFAFLAGASTAAYITTSSQRTEKRREQMTNAVVEVEESLSSALNELAGGVIPVLPARNEAFDIEAWDYQQARQRCGKAES